MKRQIAQRFQIAMVLLAGSSPIFGQTADSTTGTFDGFAATRTEILSMISGSTQNVRIATDFLSDGEIVSALYIAQYRKVNVQVLLGQGRATHVLSRLSYLKAQNIPTWLRPKQFFSQHPTIIQTDQKLFALDAELDYMARHRKFTLKRLPDQMLENFISEFTNAQSLSVAPAPKALPLVGRPNPRSSYYRDAASQGISPRSRRQPQGDQSVHEVSQPEGAYRYSRVREKPSAGIATKLPRTTILQNRAQQPDSSPTVNSESAKSDISSGTVQ